MAHHQKKIRSERRGTSRAIQLTPLLRLVTKYLGLDVEFQSVLCKRTGRRWQRVGRISICNYHGIVLYDVFAFYPHVDGYIVKLPPSKLKLGVYWDDINPKFGARPIAEVEENVRQLIEGNIVVGHAIHNDIKSLSAWVFEGVEIRDTQQHSCYRQYATPVGGDPGLKVLAPKLLGYTIKQGNYSSAEDAKATMDLFKLHEPCIEREQGSHNSVDDDCDNGHFVHGGGETMDGTVIKALDHQDSIDAINQQLESSSSSIKSDTSKSSTAGSSLASSNTSFATLASAAMPSTDTVTASTMPSFQSAQYATPPGSNAAPQGAGITPNETVQVNSIASHVPKPRSRATDGKATSHRSRKVSIEKLTSWFKNHGQYE